MSNTLMAGKRGLIMGLANEKSIAWGIARACADAGAELAFTYMGDAFRKRVAPLAGELGAEHLFNCDVSDPDSIDAAFADLREAWGEIDFVVHAIGYSDKSELRGRYVDTRRQNFLNTMDVSVYSFTAVAQRAEKMMRPGGSMLTLTYYGAEKVMPHYNVMGVAKAALEASVIGDFRYILKWNELNSPLRRNVTIDDVGKSALYLLSDLGSGTTGEVLHVDAGYHVVGMKAVDAPDIDKS